MRSVLSLCMVLLAAACAAPPGDAVPADYPALVPLTDILSPVDDTAPVPADPSGLAARRAALQARAAQLSP